MAKRKPKAVRRETPDTGSLFETIMRPRVGTFWQFEKKWPNRTVFRVERHLVGDRVLCSHWDAARGAWVIPPAIGHGMHEMAEGFDVGRMLTMIPAADPSVAHYALCRACAQARRYGSAALCSECWKPRTG